MDVLCNGIGCFCDHSPSLAVELSYNTSGVQLELTMGTRLKPLD